MTAKVLIISGFDPCAQAGVLKDTQVIQALQDSSVAVTTCITYQNEHKITGIKWLTQNEILQQLNALDLYASSILTVKISLVPNMKAFKAITSWIRCHCKKAKIIWDPVYQSSSKFNFFSLPKYLNFKKILPQLDWVTPNSFEFQTWFSSEKEFLKFQKPLQTHWIIKSYQQNQKTITDFIIFQQQQHLIKNTKLKTKPKHGTGCIFSTAFALFLSQGFDELKAYQKANIVLRQYLVD